MNGTKNLNFNAILFLSFALHTMFAFGVLFLLPQHKNPLPVEVVFGVHRTKKIGMAAKGNGIIKTSSLVKKENPTVIQSNDSLKNTTESSVNSPTTGLGLGHAKEGLENGGEGGGIDTPLSRYLFQVAKLIEENKIYPLRARKLGQEGIVLLEIELEPSGKVKKIKVLKKPSYESLVIAAKDIIKKIKKFPKIPPDVVLKTITVPIHFKLQK